MSDSVKTCLHCGKRFERGNRQLWNFHKAKYCGRECSFAAHKFTPEQSLAAFWSRVQKSDTCWIYTGAKDATGYGYLHNPLGGSRYTTAHRYSWVLANGPVPAGLHVLHRCDVHACCNPAHLFVGTAQDNMLDMYAKGRDATRDLTDDQVREVRKLFGTMPQKEIAKQFNTREGTISAIKMGRSYVRVK